MVRSKSSIVPVAAVLALVGSVLYFGGQPGAGPDAFVPPALAEAGVPKAGPAAAAVYDPSLDDVSVQWYGDESVAPPRNCGFCMG
mmetsp:Transcript_46744/g.121298  ORF Transcript_46744/g.121298 Transcript_46744/m.121298 type:complete len:85 (-) Transcript_46744:101-355(-)